MQQSFFTTPLFYIRQHRLVMWIIAIVLVAQFIVFKCFYPHANFMPDSYGYLQVAKNNDPVGMWPVGYSMFLRLESIFTRSDIALVLLQFLFLQACIFYTLFGIAHCLVMTKKSLYLLVGIFLVNPAPVLIANYVAADALFTGLTLLWFCLLVQLLLQPSRKLIWWQVIILFVLFTIRYNALYYPIIAFLILLVVKLPWGIRLKGIALMLLLVLSFVGYNMFQYKTLTGKSQFSPFGGWMLAGDALFMYSRMPRDKDAPPKKFAALHAIVNHHMDSLDTVKSRPDSMMGVYYIWNGPLRRYMGVQYLKDSVTAGFVRWASMGPLFQQYGSYLIRKHPIAYAQYFLWPNTGYYFNPPAEFLSVYNQGMDSVGWMAKDWFGYKNRYVKNYSNSLEFSKYISVANTLVNVIFFSGLICFCFLKGFREWEQMFTKLIVVALLVLVFNFCFSVFLAPVELRYQLFSFVLISVFSVDLMVRIYALGKAEKDAVASVL